MADILYRMGEKLYVNLTNACPCRCTFCIRQNGDGVGSADSLWFERDPSLNEVLDAFGEIRLEEYEELIFCGYGEPTCALENLLAVCRYVRRISAIPIRLNTNGLADLIWKKETAPLLKGLVDTVSISLNAPDAQKYAAVVRPSFGEQAFDAMLRYAAACKAVVPKVQFTIVDVLPEADIAACERVAAEVGVPLRVRRYSA